MNVSNMTPWRMTVRLVVYFTCTIALLASLVLFSPLSTDVLPVGGNQVDVPGTSEDILEIIEAPQDGDMPTEFIRGSDPEYLARIVSDR